MLRKLRRRLKARGLKKTRLLAAALGAATVLAASPQAAWATAYTSTVTGGTYTGDSIATTDSNAVEANGSNINLTNCTVTTSGSSGNGLISVNGGRIIMTGGRVTTSGGSHAFGVYAIAGGTVNLTDVAVATSGSDTHGIYAIIGGITMTGGSVTTSGNGAYGIYAVNGVLITLTDVAVRSSGTALRVDNGLVGAHPTITATVHGQSVSGGNYLLYVDDGGSITLTANDGSQVSGAAHTGTGTSTLTLNNSTWTNTGNSNLTTLALSGGSVAFSAPAAGAYKTLTLGTLSGSGGSFYLNTNVAAGTSDTMTVTGSASGSHNLYVSNTGGTPTNPHQTVRLIHFTGANNATFSGGSDLGAYRYGLARGSALSSAYTYDGSSVSGSDYYLYNTFAPSAASRAAMSQNAGATVAWYGELNEIKKRLGELRVGKQSSDDFWVRTYADKFRVAPAGGNSFDQKLRGVELGKDNPQKFADGKKYTGFLVGAAKADNTFPAGGSGRTNSVYAGAYGSWLRDDGSYFDLIGKYNRFSHRFDSPVLGGSSDSGSYKNSGFGLSAELGKRFERGHGAFIEPAAELSALWAGRASYTTANGLAVETPAARSLQLRLGVTAGRKWQDAGGAARQFYGKFSWVNEYKGDSVTRVDTASFDSSLKGHQWVAGLGYIEDNGRRQLYIDVERSRGNTVSKSWGANLGCRWKF